MTVAVCTRCGAVKHGALTRCRGCGFEPKANEDKAKAMILSERCVPKEELEKLGARIRDGKPVDYPADLVRRYVATFEQNPDAKEAPRSLEIGCLVLVAAIAAALAWILFR